MDKNTLEIRQWAEQLQAMSVGEIRLNEPLSRHTTFRIGGPADILLLPETIVQVQSIAAFAKQQGIPLIILGGGSNLLAADDGCRGIVVKLASRLNAMQFTGTTVYAEAGVPLPALAYQAYQHQLSGVEFVAGIPGTIGGAVVMNAGAHGQKLSDIISTIICCDQSGHLLTIDKESAGFAYRDSMFKKQREFIILAINFQLSLGKKAQIKTYMAEYTVTRQAKQPLEYPSAGSVFKNPAGFTAGQLIEMIGAKGWCVGDAQVSEKHSNFIVNRGQATCSDVLSLVARIQEAVFMQTGIMLEQEILLLK